MKGPERSMLHDFVTWTVKDQLRGQLPGIQQQVANNSERVDKLVLQLEILEQKLIHQQRDVDNVAAFINQVQLEHREMKERNEC